MSVFFINQIRAIACDLDGSLMPQGGPLQPKEAKLLRAIQSAGIPLWASTGKNYDYVRGLACGACFFFDGIIAETGGHIVRTISRSPLAFEQVGRRAAITGDVRVDDIAKFAFLIELDSFRGTFLMEGKRQGYRPELKHTMISMFPDREADLKATASWAEYFRTIVTERKLRLTVLRHRDGCVDIISDGINKHLGNDAISSLYGCEIRQILTVADGVNDIELVEGTTPIAVANAIDPIKEIARRSGGYVARHPEGKGFAEGILHFARQARFSTGNELLVSTIEGLYPDLDSSIATA